MLRSVKSLRDAVTHLGGKKKPTTSEHRNSSSSTESALVCDIFDARERMALLPNKELLLSTIKHGEKHRKERYEELKVAAKFLRTMPNQEDATAIRSAIVDVLENSALPLLDDTKLTVHALLDNFLAEHGNPTAHSDEFSKFIGTLKGNFDVNQKLDVDARKRLHQALETWLDQKLGNKNGKVLPVLALQQALTQKIARSASLSDYQSLRRSSCKGHIDSIFVNQARESATQELLGKIEALQPKIDEFNAALGANSPKTLTLEKMQVHHSQISAPLNEIIDACLEDDSLLQSCIERNPELTTRFIDGIPSAFAPGKKTELQQKQGFIAGMQKTRSNEAYSAHQEQCALAGLHLEIDPAE